MSSQWKCFIPTAGSGTRISPQFGNINKALIPLNGKAVISHILDRIPSDIEVVIGLGYQGNLVKEYLELAHPDYKFIFTYVDKFEGPESGPGRTLLSAKAELQCPFIFWACDTLIANWEDKQTKLPTPLHYNWLGVDFTVSDEESYRSVQTNNNLDIVERLIDKQKPQYDSLTACVSTYKVRRFPYIGICGIKDYEKFWDNMLDSTICYEIGESFAIQNLLADHEHFKTESFNWYDTGNEEALKETKKFYSDSTTILPKENEAIWFVNDKVIKYNADRKFIYDRKHRGFVLERDGFVPTLIDKPSYNMYGYYKEDGEVLSNCINLPLFEKLLNFLKNDFWERKKGYFDEEIGFQKDVLKFYKDKTYQRVEDYCNKYDARNEQELVNGELTPPIYEILNQVPWSILSSCAPYRYHGDLHFENILYNKKKDKFILLDWRQDFAGYLSWGDVKYDLAKLRHGCIINHKIVNKNNFSFHKNEYGDVTFDFLRPNKLVKCEEFLVEWLSKQRMSNNITSIRLNEILTHLIFLNIATLHEAPYCHLLYYLGKQGLYNAI